MGDQVYKMENAPLEPLTHLADGIGLQSRSLHEAYRAKLAKLEFETKTGKLVDVDLVKREARNTGRIIREQLLGIPSRVAPIILGELGIEDTNFQQKLYTILTKEIHEALEGLQDDKRLIAAIQLGTTEGA